jgi:pimeloyl-ACP methyl ester carboxylesterase
MSIGALAERLSSLNSRVEDTVVEGIGTFQLEGRSLLHQMFWPESQKVRGPALVLCPSMIEFTTLQRTEITLARSAARLGHACIYAQPPGSGDSEGSSEICTISRRVETAVAALDQLTTRFPAVTQACFVGARLGGTVAAMAAQARGARDGAVLWDPALDADTYWDQARRMARISAVVRGHGEFVDPQKKIDKEGRASILGLEVTSELVEDLRSVSGLFTGPKLAGPVLLISLNDSLAEESASRLRGVIPDIKTHSLALKNQWHLGVTEAPEAIEPTLEWMQRSFA